jgi:hypothetical protein
MPNTPDGKAVSRMNAMKHGLCAIDDIFIASLKSDEQLVFNRLRDELYEINNPETEKEERIVDNIAIQHFRLFRLYKFENIASQNNHDDLLSSESVLRHLDRLLRYDVRIDRKLRRLENTLQTAKIMRRLKMDNSNQSK